MNAVSREWDRDLALPVHETRKLEAGSTKKGKAAGTVAFPEMRAGRIALNNNLIRALRGETLGDGGQRTKQDDEW